jgi:hypothetical protein
LLWSTAADHLTGREIESKWHRDWFSGSMVVTGKRFGAFRSTRALFEVPLEPEKLERLTFSAPDDSTLVMTYEASDFHAGQSGSGEIRFSTSQARDYLECLQQQSY